MHPRNRQNYLPNHRFRKFYSFYHSQFLEEAVPHGLLFGFADVVGLGARAAAGVAFEEVAVLAADALALDGTLESVLVALAVLLAAVGVLAVAPAGDVDEHLGGAAALAAGGREPRLVGLVLGLKGVGVLLLDDRDDVGAGLVVGLVEAALAVAVLAEGEGPEALAVQFDALGLLAVAADLLGLEGVDGGAEDGGRAGRRRGLGDFGLGGAGDRLGEQGALDGLHEVGVLEDLLEPRAEEGLAALAEVVLAGE